MLVFVDESGASGLKLGKGSSEFFVLTLVIFTENEAANTSDLAVDAIRTILNLSDRTEFKFNKLNDNLTIS